MFVFSLWRFDLDALLAFGFRLLVALSAARSASQVVLSVALWPSQVARSASQVALLVLLWPSQVARSASQVALLVLLWPSQVAMWPLPPAD